MIALVAFILRLGYWTVARDEYYYAGISATYANMGWNLRHGCGLALGGGNFDRLREIQQLECRLVDPAEYPASPVCEGKLSNFRMPAYPIALAFFFWLFDSERYDYIQLFQALVDAVLGILLVFGIARHILSPSFSLLASFFYAVFLPIARLSVVALPDAFMCTVFLSSLYGVLEVRRGLLEDKSVLRGVLFFAIASVLGTYLNNQTFFFPCLFLFVAILFELREICLRMIVILIAVQILAIIVLIPWGLHSHAATGRFSISRNWVWFGLWESLGEFPNPWGLALNDKAYIQWLSTQDGSVAYQSLESEKITSEYILSTVLCDPRFPPHVLFTFARRVPQVVFAVASDALPDTLRNTLNRAAGKTVVALFLWFSGVCIFVGAFAGYIVLWRRDKIPLLAYYAVFPCFVILFSLIFHVEARYIVPGIVLFPVLFAIVAENLQPEQTNS